MERVSVETEMLPGILHSERGAENMLKSRAVITKLEAAFDVNSLYYNELRIWPLIRSNLRTILERPECKSAQEKPKGDLHCPSFTVDEDQLSELREYRGSDFMFAVQRMIVRLF